MEQANGYGVQETNVKGTITQGTNVEGTNILGTNVEGTNILGTNVERKMWREQTWREPMGWRIWREHKAEDKSTGKRSAGNKCTGKRVNIT